MNPGLFIPTLAVLAFAHAATAQDIIKANNTNSLNLPTSWQGGVVPGPSNVAVWNSTVSNNTTNLGAKLSWAGLRHDAGGGAVTINGTHSLALGAAGIVQSNLSQNLTFNAPVLFSEDSTINLNAANRTITFAGGADLGGHTVEIPGNATNNRSIAGSLSNGSFYITGPATTSEYQFNATATGNFTHIVDGRARLIINSTAASSTHLDIELADKSQFRLGTPFDNGTLQIGNLSGETETTITPDYQVSGGTPVVVRTLAVHQTDDDTFAGNMVNSNNNRSFGFTKGGNATLSLTNPALTYTGTTTINGGILRIASEGRLGNGNHPGPVSIQGNGVLLFDSAQIQSLTGTLTGNGTLTKANTGIVTFAGDGSGFSGDTMVNEGRILLNGTLAGNVAVASGAAFGGSGSSTGHLATAATASIILTGGAVTDGVSFDGVTIADPTFIEFSSPQQEAIVYEVLNYGAGGISGYDHLVPLARGTLSHDVANQKVLFTGNAPGTRTWNIHDGVWNAQGILENWLGGDKVFIQGDSTIFNEPAADTTITLDGLVAPAGITVQNSSNKYTFDGPGEWIGNGSITKSGNGILEVGTSNTKFAGPVNVLGGILRIIEGGLFGTNPISVTTGLEVDVESNITLFNGISGSGTLVKRGPGTLRIDGTNESTFTGDVTIEAGKAVLAKPTALGNSTSVGAKTITIHDGGQLDLNFYTPTTRKSFNLQRTCSYKIAGHGDGTGALVNNSGGLKFFGGVQNLELTADASIGGTGDFETGYYWYAKDNLFIPGQITGNGHTLTKLGSNLIVLGAPATNLTIQVMEGVLAAQNHDDCFGGPEGLVTVLPGAGLAARGVTYNQADEPLEVSTPVIFMGNNTLQDLAGTNPYNSTATWAAPMTVQSGTLTVTLVVRNKIISGTITGPGGIVKNGLRTLTLSGNNTYTGPTSVNEGTISIQHPFLSDSAAVSVAAGATLQLDFTGTDTIGSLSLAGLAMEPGTYNATTHPGLLAGSGSLQVAAVVNDYDDWSSSYSLIGGPEDDDDSDGLTNFQEYAFALDPTDGASNSPITALLEPAATFTYTRRKPSLTGLNYTYESSTTLNGWQHFTPLVPDASDHGDPVETITVNIPAGLLAEPRLFLRVKATNCSVGL